MTDTNTGADVADRILSWSEDAVRTFVDIGDADGLLGLRRDAQLAADLLLATERRLHDTEEKLRAASAPTDTRITITTPDRAQATVIPVGAVEITFDKPASVTTELDEEDILTAGDPARSAERRRTIAAHGDIAITTTAHWRVVATESGLTSQAFLLP